MADGTTFIGLDVHAATITAAAVLPGGELKRLGTFANAPAAIAERVALWGDPTQLSVAYEAGPCGYVLARHLAQLGVACQVVAPALIPRKPGDRVKTDRRDAETLAVALAKDLVTAVPIPTPAQEALRALSRAREAAVHDLHRVRQRLVKFLRIQGIAEPAGKRWTAKWTVWLTTVSCAEPAAGVGRAPRPDRSDAAAPRSFDRAPAHPGSSQSARGADRTVAGILWSWPDHRHRHRG